jgi:hypothetical protein
VDDDNTSLEKPRQEMASECHEAVSYSKTHVKQRDRQRVSCESVLKQGDRQEAYNSNDQVNTNTSSQFSFAEGWGEDEEEGDDIPDLQPLEEDDLPALEWPDDDISFLAKLLFVQKSTDDEPPQKKSRWELDYSEVMEPTDNDVLCGCGGHANTHPGNIRFREKVLELLPEYNKSSVEGKTRISVVLMKTVTEKYHFLKMGQDKKWYRVLNPRNKASQVYGTPRRQVPAVQIKPNRRYVK